MNNIYKIIEENEKIFDDEFNEIQEGYDEILLLDQSTIITLEELVYNNPEKKKLIVLIEEAEANETKKTNDIINKLKEQMKKVLNWIMNIFKHYDKLFAEGANFVKNNDLNACMNKIKANRKIVKVKWHRQKPPFKKIESVCLGSINIDKVMTKYMRSTATIIADKTNNLSTSDIEDNTEQTLEARLKQFKLDKDSLDETNITNINVLVIHNDLVTLPSSNKKLNNIKAKIQKLYNSAINSVRSSMNRNINGHNSASKELTFINSKIKKINEQIRVYAKLMTMIFKEDYNLARLIVSSSQK